MLQKCYTDITQGSSYTMLSGIEWSVLGALRHEKANIALGLTVSDNERQVVLSWIKTRIEDLERKRYSADG